jgi:two-component system NtrC family sensor kinase
VKVNKREKPGTRIAFPRSLKYEVGVSLAVALTLAVGIFTFLMLRHQRSALLMEAVRHVNQVSEIVLNSTRSAMIHNRSDQVGEIIRDIGRSQVVITKVRILKKDGTIIHSCCDHEIAKRVDREAEACILCHKSREPRLQISLAERVRIFQDPEGGGRSLGMINVIRNEPACSSAECHVHPPERRILGILDVVYSLKEIDRQRRIESLTIAGFSLGIVVMASLLGLFVVQRRIYLPLRDLEQGAQRLARGELEEEIPVRRPDELGHLASSFNHMMNELAFSDRQLQEWNQTLEERVEEKTEELRIAEGKTAQAEKLASVGLLAAGVAHELNNPLTGVLTFSSLMRQKMPEGSLEAQDMDLIIRETRRCSAIIKRLLDFAREERPEKKHVDINELIGEAVKIVSHSASTHDIETEFDLDGDIPPLWIDRGQIKQVMINLLVNAADAIGEKGNIRIATGVLPGRHSPEEGGDPVPMVEIAISDTGSGISKEQLSKLFDPFFTTKEFGKGTGLGLSVTYGIVRAHHGRIDVVSSVGEGTTFSVLLPLEREERGGLFEKHDTGR